MMEPACFNEECKYNKIKINCAVDCFEYMECTKETGNIRKKHKRIIFAAKLDSGAVLKKTLCEVCAKDKEIIKRTLRK